MLDSRIYAANTVIIMQRNRENFCLEVTNILNLFISVGLLVMYLCLRTVENNLIYTISTGLEMVYLVTWSFALYSLFARFKASEHLLPRKWVFITHAALLTLFLLCSIIVLVMHKVLDSGNCGATCFYICADILNITLTIGNACEVTTFAYVVYSQISFTGKQKGRRDALRNVLLCGRATIEDLERAVLEQNKDLPEEELNDIRGQIGEFKSFFYETESS